MPAYPTDGGVDSGYIPDVYDEFGNPVDLSNPPPTIDGGGGPADTTGSGGTSIAQWGTMFSNVAVNAASIFKTVSGGGQVINPRTGLPYSQAQLAQLRAQQTGMGGLSG